LGLEKKNELILGFRALKRGTHVQLHAFARTSRARAHTHTATAAHTHDVQAKSLLLCQRATPKKTETPVVGGWVRGQKRLGSDFPPEICYRVFEVPSPRNARKRDKNKS
jgi:hypothetical protein